MLALGGRECKPGSRGRDGFRYRSNQSEAGRAVFPGSRGRATKGA